MSVWIAFGTGLVIGAIMGVVIMCILSSSCCGECGKYGDEP